MTYSPHNVYWISDPGHAWLAVSLEAYPEALNYGTGYGYLDNTYVFLEEDLEAVAFLTDHAEVRGSNKRGMIPEKIFDFDAPIRRLGRNLDMLDADAYYARLRADNAAHAEQVTA